MDLFNSANFIAALVTIATGVVVVLVWSGARWRKRAAGKAPPPPRRDLELIPIHYELYVATGSVPTATVRLRAVNYLSKPVELTHIRVSYLNVSSAPTIRDIPCVHRYVVPPKNSQEIFCERELHESQAAQFRSLRNNRNPQGGVHMEARGRVGGKEVAFDHVQTQVICGHIEGIPET